MSRALALAHSCPKCGAPPRMPCMGKRAARRAAHRERFDEAWAWSRADNKGPRETRCNESGRVYFIGPEGAGLVKIGWTKRDPNRRLKQLQTGNGQRLHLFGSVPGTKRDEQALHAEFANFRTEGEWFRGEGTLRELVIRLVDQQ